MGVARNQFRASALLRHVGLSCLAHKSWQDHADSKAYMLGTRWGFRDNSSFATTDDRSRDSGRDWLCDSVYGYEVNLIGWLQLVVTREF